MTLSERVWNLWPSPRLPPSHTGCRIYDYPLYPWTESAEAPPPWQIMNAPNSDVWIRIRIRIQIRIQGFFSWIRIRIQIQTSKRRIRIRIQEKMGGFGFESRFGPLLFGPNFKNLLLWPQLYKNEWIAHFRCFHASNSLVSTYFREMCSVGSWRCENMLVTFPYW